MSGLPGGALPATIAFVLVALASIVSALAVVTRRGPVAAVAWLVIHFVATACAYVLLASQFIAAVQVLVYAGAIMVLFLFVIMLLGIDRKDELMGGSGLGRKVLVVVLGLVLVTLVGRIGSTPGVPGQGGVPVVEASTEDSVAWLATNLFESHFVAFEVASIILIAAMAGVMVYTTRRTAGEPDRTGGA